jgi:hypothetical protein
MRERERERERLKDFMFSCYAAGAAVDQRFSDFWEHHNHLESLLMHILLDPPHSFQSNMSVVEP